jgi:hypothetical protein
MVNLGWLEYAINFNEYINLIFYLYIMKKLLTLAFGILVFISSCKKNTKEDFNLSKAKTINVNGISNPLGSPNHDSVKAYSGTMLANTTYTVVGNIVIPKGDTIFVQPGVTVCVDNGSAIMVQGALICVGTQTSPIWFTRCGRPKTDNIGQSQATDSAWSGGSEVGIWTGIECDTSCTLLVLKWTHVEFVGAGANSPNCAAFCDGINIGATKTNFGIWFQNINGNFIMEDSWEYGTQDDGIRISFGKFDIMRNTFEKQGYIGGDCNNVKSGGVGDCAYNLYVGCATNGSKGSNKGSEPIQCNMNIYNNTYINCGYRQNEVGRGGCIDYEQGAEGYSYNNLIVDCKFGFRVVGGTTVADTIDLFYGNNYVYGDSLELTEQFYPVGYITKPGAYVIPNPSFSNTGYVYSPAGAAAPAGQELTDDQGFVSSNNPGFVSFPLPENPSHFPGMNVFSDINNNNPEHGYNFHLQSASPCIGVGNPNSSYMLNASAAVSFKYVSNGQVLTFTPNESIPCSDVGCYPTIYPNGNLH